jgi:hypothetical protein
MALTGAVPAHPAPYSPEIVALLATLIHPGERVHDPFAGLGLRLGALCDQIGATFTGCDIEPWDGRDPRVQTADSTLPGSYPAGPFTVVTSPVYYGNRISSDYVNGPTPTTKQNGRRAYGISRGQALDPGNAARVCRPGQVMEYLALHSRAMECWSDRVLLNVDSPMGDDMVWLLGGHGYTIVAVHTVGTRRYRVGNAGEGADVRASHEVVIEATRRQAVSHGVLRCGHAELPEPNR